MDNLLTTVEAAHFLHISIRTFKYWIKATSTRPVQTGARGVKFYSPVQLDALRSAMTCAKALVQNADLHTSPVQNNPQPVQSTRAEVQRPVQNPSEVQSPVQNFDSEYLRLIKLDIADAQAHLDELSEIDRRGLTLETLRHFRCGYLSDWVLTKSRAELACGLYVKDTGEPKHLPPPSERIIIPTSSMNHFNAVATPRSRGKMDKAFWKQHAGSMELFADTDALKADTLVVVEGEIDAMSIWQATQGKVAGVAILGCSNANKTLGSRLHELKGKRFIILLDADEAGKKNANKLCDTLIREHHPAVIRYLYDYLPLNLKKNPQAVKVDANEILIHHGEDTLCRVMIKILEAESELDQIAEQIEQEQADAGNETANPSLNMLGTARSEQLHQKITPRSRNDERHIISDALKFIPARELSRDEWFSVGCVLCRYGFELADFDTWSNDGDPRYSADSCRQQWESMKTNDELKGEGYKIGTLINLAKKFGYKPKNIPRRDTSDTLDTDFNEEKYISGLTEDLDNARRLATFCCERVKWLTDIERWLVWNKKGLWQRCSDKNSCLAPEVSHLADLMMNHAIHLAKEARRLGEEYLKVSTETVDNVTRIRTDGDPAIKQARDKSAQADEKKDKAFAVAYDFRRAKKISSAITMMKGESSILITSDDLDKHSNLLNCLNGVVDLQTGKLYPLDPKYLITQQCRASFDPNAKSPLVENFFKAIQPDEMTRAGLLRWLGYCLTGEVSEEKFMVHTGSGGNGKGVLSTTVLELLDSYGIGLAPTALLKSNRPYDADKPTTALNGLELARFAISEEMPADGELDLSLIRVCW